MDQEHKMTPTEWQMFNHQKKVDKLFNENRYYCTCGHSVVMKPTTERILCSHCGYYIYRDKKEMFKDRMRLRLKDVI